MKNLPWVLMGLSLFGGLALTAEEETQKTEAVPLHTVLEGLENLHEKKDWSVSTKKDHKRAFRNYIRNQSPASIKALHSMVKDSSVRMARIRPKPGQGDAPALSFTLFAFDPNQDVDALFRATREGVDLTMKAVEKLPVKSERKLVEKVTAGRPYAKEVKSYQLLYAFPSSDDFRQTTVGVWLSEGYYLQVIAIQYPLTSERMVDLIREVRKRLKLEDEPVLKKDDVGGLLPNPSTGAFRIALAGRCDSDWIKA